LGIATLFALFIAFVVLLLFVLPAEYGIDPTNFGRITGIGRLSEGGGEFQVAHNGTVHRLEPAAPRNDTVVLTLTGVGDFLEFKFHLEANQTMLYIWTSNAPVDFDFHGEPDADRSTFSSYDASQGNGRSGSFQAPFTGRHGWFFQNPGDATVTITLQTWGYYDVVGRV
jgi:hypothetical protein